MMHKTRKLENIQTNNNKNKPSLILQLHRFLGLDVHVYKGGSKVIVTWFW